MSGAQSQQPVWQLALPELGRAINVNAPHDPLDHVKIISVLTELYYVGERPTPAQMEAFLLQLWPHAQYARKDIAGFWRKILDNPRRRFEAVRTQGWSYRHPFFLLDKLATQHQLTSVEDRLRAQLRTDFNRWLAELGADPYSPAANLARRDYVLAENALRVWIRSRRPIRGRWGNPFWVGDAALRFLG